MEEHLPHHFGKLQVGEYPTGPSSLGSDVQSLLEFHHRHSTTIMGGGSIKQTEKAIYSVSLQRIRVINTRKKASGPKGNDNSSYGEPLDVEANLDTCSGREMRCSGMLQGRCGGNFEVHDMETGVEDLKGFVEEDRMEHDGSCHNESESS